MPPVTLPTEKWAGKVREVTLGGNGRRAVTVGGETTLPFLHFEGQIPHRPAIAIQIEDREPLEWSPVLREAWGDTMKDPARWAQRAVELGAEIVAVTLASAHPDNGNTGAAEAAALAKRLLEAVDVPLIFYGPEVAEKDNEILVAVSDATAGQNVALGYCEDKNYRTIVAACLANNHAAIARTPIEINLAKQLNILIRDMGLSPDRILMDPTTGALGYGLEYTYSVMERLRLAGLQGDGMAGMPMITTPGYEAWRQKEARAAEGVPAEWGDLGERSVVWEALTAATLLQAGADILVMRHPRAVAAVRQAIDKLMAQS